MPLSAAPRAWLSTTANGQTLSTTNVATQISDGNTGTTLIGGAGDNTYGVVDSNTNIVEAAGGGIDTVISWTSFALSANIENLTLQHDHATGQGNSLANLIIANGVDDIVNGGGGNDVLVDGGAGRDVFEFTPAGGGHDVVYGFQTSGASHDFLQLGGYGITNFAQVQSDLSQVGADTLLTLSPTASVLLHNTQASSLTAADFAYQLDTSAMHMTFDDEFNSLSLYNPATGTGTWKTNFISGSQTGSNSWSSRTLATNSEQEIYVDPSYTGVAGGKTALGINPFSITNGVLDIHAAPTPTADLLALDGFKYYLRPADHAKELFADLRLFRNQGRDPHWTRRLADLLAVTHRRHLAAGDRRAGSGRHRHRLSDHPCGPGD